MLDEDNSIGADNALMKGYNNQANAKLIKKKPAAVTNEGGDASDAHDDSYQNSL